MPTFGFVERDVWEPPSDYDIILPIQWIHSIHVIESIGPTHSQMGVCRDRTRITVSSTTSNMIKKQHCLIPLTNSALVRVAITTSLMMLFLSQVVRTQLGSRPSGLGDRSFNDSAYMKFT